MNDPMSCLLFIIFWAGIGAFGGIFIGDLGDKNNGGIGLVLGIFLGPFGWLITAVLPPAKGPVPPVPVKARPSEAELKIAIMEAQLAQLKADAMASHNAAAKTCPRKGYDDDGQIPTYKLD